MLILAAMKTAAGVVVAAALMQELARAHRRVLEAPTLAGRAAALLVLAAAPALAFTLLLRLEGPAVLARIAAFAALLGALAAGHAAPGGREAGALAGLLAIALGTVALRGLALAG